MSGAAPPEHVDLTQVDADTRLEAQRALGDVLEDVKDALKDTKEGVYVELCEAAVALSRAKSGASIERVAALEGELDMAVYNCQRQRGKKRWARHDVSSCIGFVVREYGVEAAAKMVSHMKRSRQRTASQMVLEFPAGTARDHMRETIAEEQADDEDDEETSNLDAVVQIYSARQEAQNAVSTAEGSAEGAPVPAPEEENAESGSGSEDSS